MSDDVKPRPRSVTLRRIFCFLVAAFLVIEIAMLPFPWSVAALRKSSPGTTALMRQRIKEAKAKEEPYQIRHLYVPLSRISESMIHAVIVGEDGTFFEHKGVDWYEVQQSVQENWEEKKIFAVQARSRCSLQKICGSRRAVIR